MQGDESGCNRQDMTIEKETFWSLTKADAFGKLASGEKGLNDSEAVVLLKKYGPNSLKGNARSSAMLLLLSQFKSPITLMLIIAALLSAFLGDVADTIIILMIVLISSLLGFWQEKGASDAMRTLQKMVQLHCNVLREAKPIEIPIEAVVPGDVVMLSAGDVVPGDSLLLNSSELFVDEAAFTGESYPVEKLPGILPAETSLSKRTNSLFMGSHVISGTARILVVNTGVRTELGKISTAIQAAPPETDFEKGIQKFGYMLMQITLVLVIVIFATNVLLHKPVLDSFLFSLALAVGLTPQLLPVIISINLSGGAKRMAKLKVIVKRLSSIENFGSMDVLCSDKTGTITKGEVMLKDSLVFNGLHSEKVLKYAWLNASMQQGFHNPIDQCICAAYQGIKEQYTVDREIPYDFIRKRLTILMANGGGHLAVTKGALNSILSICDSVEDLQGKILPMDANKEAILSQYEQLSAQGYRTLGVAYKKLADTTKPADFFEEDMVFLGFITLFDPPRENVSDLISKLGALGVKLKIITGDNALVAKNLAQQVGIAAPKIITGNEMRNMSNAALFHRVPLTDIFAEIEPNQKERIILILKKAGHVVGFMGDGINDAPALHAADVGISVDSAVDVAKEAADIVLLSPGLEVLIEGIVEGRRTFTNTMKYILMSTSANFGNMFSMACVSVFLPFLPLLPKQILLNNLLTDFPEMAISTDRVDVQRTASPQRWDLKFIRRFMVTFGLLSSLFDLLMFLVLLKVLHAQEKAFQTAWFIESVISAILIVLLLRTRLPFFKSLPGRYLVFATLSILIVVLVLPFTMAGAWFGLARLPFVYYLWMLAVVLMYLAAAELAKKLFYRKMGRGH